MLTRSLCVSLLLAIAASGATVTNSVVIERPLKETFRTVTTAVHWPKWHPATLGVSGDIHRPMRLGSKIREKAKIGGQTGEGEWTVTDFARNRTVTLSLPATRLGDLLIRYRFERISKNTTRFTRELTYDASKLPPPVAAAIRQQLERDSSEAVQNLERFVETGAVR